MRRLTNAGGGSCLFVRNQETNITGEKAVKDAKMKLNDALIESCTADFI